MARLRIRLKDRLPNAPPHFVGRERERAWLSEAIRRGPVAGLTGPAGIGKTATILQTLHSSFPESVHRTVYVHAQVDEPAQQLLFDLLKAVAGAARRDANLADLGGEPLDILEATIDIAEAAEMWVVVEDLHHAESSEIHEMLLMLASYARKSRWIVATQSVVRVPQLKGQLLAIGGMGESDLFEMAVRLQPGSTADDHNRAVASSGGSPWLLAQGLTHGAAGSELTRERVLRGIDPSVHPLLHALAVLNAPLPRSVVAHLTPLPTEELLAGLERRGLLVQQRGNLAIHPSMRVLFETEELASDQDLRHRAAAVLEASEVPEQIVEAARQLRASGDVEALIGLLDRQAEMLFAEAQAPRLWSAIRDVHDARLSAHQMRCAAELGNPTALNSLHAPPAHEDRLVWARTLYARGQRAEARSLAEAVAGDASQDGDSESEAEARVLIARCLLGAGQAIHATEQLAALPTLADEALTHRVESLSARCSVRVGATTLESRLRSLAGGPNMAARLDIAVAYCDLGQFERAEEILDSLRSTRRGGQASHLLSRQVLLLKSTILLRRGRLADARSLLDAVQPYVRAASLLRPWVTELRSTHDAIFGAFGDDGGLVTALVEDAEVDVAMTTRLRLLASSRARTVGNPPTSGAAPRGSKLHFAMQRERLRAGEVEGDAAEPLADAETEATLFAAESSLVRGEIQSALRLARQASHRAEGLGALARLDAACVLNDALLCGGKWEERRALADSMRSQAREWRSPRLDAICDFYESLDQPETIERSADRGDVAPIVARRARALLTGEHAVDAIDARVLDALRSMPGLPVFDDGPMPWAAAWGLDHTRQLVWLADGRTIDFSRKALLRKLLAALMDAGAATKEELVVGVWEESAYHPGRHDPRLHMSMRKLRELLEDDPSRPQRIMTTEDGYRIAEAGRQVRRRIS